MSRLEIRQLTKQFPTPAEPLVVLRGVDLELQQGQSAAVLGPSGSGKSTLLHIVGTLDTPTSGTVELDGRNPFALPEPELARFRYRHIGFVFQDHYLLPQLTVLENVLVPVLSQGAATEEQAARARMLLQRVGLEERMDHRPAEISGGERQRAAIARALVAQPALLLADEPTGNLDQTTAQSVARLMLELQEQEGFMLLVVTHSLELARLLQRRYELKQGHLVPQP